jgi:predicted dehydrogenase
MGNRRVRNLQALGYTDIVGYDINTESAIKTASKYSIQYTKRISDLWNNKPDCAIISVPPLKKQEYIDICGIEKIPCFCEADVATYSGTYFSSASMRFYPAIQKIKELLDTGTLGKVYTFSFHMGQHLRDWHPGANYSNYYAAKKESGACKEMFAFELGWLSMLFGRPVDAKGIIDKKLDDPDITADDVFSTTVKFNSSYMLIMTDFGLYKDYGKQSSKYDVVGVVLIDILSRPAIRELRIVGEKCNLFWNWDYNCIELEYPNGEISMIFYPKWEAADGYNANICEFMYEREIENFINAIQNKAEYYYPKEDEEACIKMLRRIES